jgi:hypothetical protein
MQLGVVDLGAVARLPISAGAAVDADTLPLISVELCFRIIFSTRLRSGTSSAAIVV